MKLGFVSAILDTWTYEEMIDFASDLSVWKSLPGRRARRREDMRA